MASFVYLDAGKLGDHPEYLFISWWILGI